MRNLKQAIWFAFSGRSTISKGRGISTSKTIGGGKHLYILDTVYYKFLITEEEDELYVHNYNQSKFSY